jgi:hypothetical protein
LLGFDAFSLDSRRCFNVFSKTDCSLSGPGLGLGVPGLSLGVTGLSLGVTGLGLGVPTFSLGIPSLGLGIPSLGLGIPSLGLGIPSLGLGIILRAFFSFRKRSGCDWGFAIFGKDDVVDFFNNLDLVSNCFGFGFGFGFGTCFSFWNILGPVNTLETRFGFGGGFDVAFGGSIFFFTILGSRRTKLGGLDFCCLGPSTNIFVLTINNTNYSRSCIFI